MSLKNENLKGSVGPELGGAATRNPQLDTMIEVPVLEDAGERNQSLERAYATGRRKQAVAKLWISINKTEKFSLSKIQQRVNEYFKNEALASNVVKPLALLNESQDFAFNIQLKFRAVGGGLSGQSDALKLAFSKSLSLLFPEIRPILRKNGFLTSDSRRKEREHPGFRTSRKPQQYSRR